MTGRLLALLFGVASYTVFFGTFLYAVGFLGNLGVPKSIDSGEPGSLFLALFVNFSLLCVFALQHTVMARIEFKRWWTRVVPQPVERSIYVLMASLAMLLLFWGWQPITVPIFQIEDESARTLMRGLFFLGVALVLYASCLIDHFDLFGLRQVFFYVRGQDYVPKRFMTRGLYRYIRHPLYLGWFVTFWATPDMTLGHLLLALGTTGYVLAAIVLEERDLGMLLGEDYVRWRVRTPKFVPEFGKRDKSQSVSHAAG